MAGQIAEGGSQRPGLPALQPAGLKDKAQKQSRAVLRKCNLELVIFDFSPGLLAADVICLASVNRSLGHFGWSIRWFFCEPWFGCNFLSGIAYASHFRPLPSVELVFVDLLQMHCKFSKLLRLSPLLCTFGL